MERISTLGKKLVLTFIITSLLYLKIALGFGILD
ncbi:hypothetical protein CR513_21508 [Mucuna pruriens]|uniref:Uncharacterized protein n=1 Tax=Mucuna pruriens TaxID=157652 RepID=A0A371GZH2_MUCPR|nr:hypothetical protein CR513_21508 [Mucuna pruriens]